MICPNCRERVSKDWKYCPYCGYTLPGESAFKDIMSTNFMKGFNNLIKNIKLSSKRPDKKNLKINISTVRGPDISFESGKSISEGGCGKLIKMPETVLEPKTTVKQFLNELNIKVILPAQIKLENVSIMRVGESLEIRAVCKDKGFFKVIHVPKEFSLESKKLNKGVLELKLRV